MVAHLLWEQRVAGSNPVTPTKVNYNGPVVKRPKTSPFHGGNRGSNPLGVTIIFSNYF